MRAEDAKPPASLQPSGSSETSMTRPTEAVRQVTIQFGHANPVAEANADKQQEDFRSDLSAMALSKNGKQLWIADDETVETTPSVERLSIQSDGSFGSRKSYAIESFVSLPVSSKDEGRVPETDTEGLSVDGGYLWLVGSHCLNRKQPKKDKKESKNIERLATVEEGSNRFILARIPLVSGPGDEEELQKTSGRLSAARLNGLDPNGLIDALRKDPHLGAFAPTGDPNAPGIPSKDNGLDIEGIAVSSGRIFLGLRGPVLRGWATILEIAVEEAAKPGELKLKSTGSSGKPYIKHFVNLNGCGIRDLCPDGKDLLILAGPTMALDGPASIFRWKDALGNAPASDSLTEADGKTLKKLLDLPVGDHVDHPEGIVLYPADNPTKKAVLLVYDSPSAARLQGDGDYRADVFELPQE
jgi:hypothetical protein